MTKEINIDEFDFESLTLGEAEELEDLLGVSLAKMEDASQIKLMRAIVFLMARRSDPDFTYADTADMSMSAVAGLMGASTDPSQ